MSELEKERVSPPLGKAVLLTLGVFALLFARAMNRPLDLDEHQFLAPSILLNRFGLQPYRDYPLFHMPALVFIYAWLIKPFSNPLMVTRTFTAVVETGTVMLVFLAGFRWPRNAELRNRWVVGLGLLALMMCGKVFSYSSDLVWNHETSILALVGAVLLELYALRTGRIWWLFIAGALAALSFSIRLTTAPALLPMALALLLPWGLGAGRRIVGLGLAVVGAILMLIPTYLIYKASPDAFVFGNLRYPVLYALYVAGNNPHHTTVLGKIGHFFQTWFGDPGNIAVILLTLAAVYRIVKEGLWKGRAGAEITTLLAVTLAVWFGLAAPFQMQLQYHAALLPFFLLQIAATVDAERFNPWTTLKWHRLLLGATIFLVVVQSWRWYWSVVYLPVPSRWTPMKVEATAGKLKQLIPAGTLVLTLDPILPLEAGFPIVPEFATGRFIEHVGKFTTVAERERFGMLYGETLEKRLSATPPGAIVYHAGLEDKAGDLIAWAKGHGMESRRVDDYVVWVPKITAPADPR